MVVTKLCLEIPGQAEVTMRFKIRRCPSTVSCTVPSCERADFRWIPTWEPKKQSEKIYRATTKGQNRFRIFHTSHSFRI